MSPANVLLAILFPNHLAVARVDDVRAGIGIVLDREENLTPRPARQDALDRDHIGMPGVDRPAQGPIGIEARRAVENFIASVAVDIRRLDVMRATAVRFAETLELPQLLESRVV